MKSKKNQRNIFSEIEYKIVELYLSGHTMREITAYVKENWPLSDKDDQFIDKFIKHSIKVLESEISTDPKETIEIHTAYLEKIYQYYDSIKNDPGWESVAVRGCNRALQGKERLHNLHQKSNMLINNSKNSPVKQDMNDLYDESKLTSAEIARINELLELCRIKK